jgi:hypothetical protein
VDRPLGLQEFEAPRISRQSAHEGGKLVGPMQGRLNPPQEPLVLIYFSLNRNQGPSAAGWITGTSIEPTNFWLVAQCLNQLRHRASHSSSAVDIIYSTKCFAIIIKQNRPCRPIDYNSRKQWCALGFHTVLRCRLKQKLRENMLPPSSGLPELDRS